jgi:hypothetical protein
MFRSHFAHRVACVGLFLIPPQAQVPSKPSDAELAAITKRGVLLAGYDAAAWNSTDAVMAIHPKEGSAGRYIARKTEAGWVVDFGRLNEAGDKFSVAYEAIETRSLGSFEVRQFAPPRQDAGFNLAAARGIDAALKDFREADRPYNIAVLPAGREGMYIYLYPAQLKADIYPLGADARYLVSPDGTKIIEKRQMHKTIIDSAPSNFSGTVATGYHTHILSDLPEDTDVMLVLARKPRVPEIVVTQTYMFTIDVNGNITVENRPR